MIKAPPRIFMKAQISPIHGISSGMTPERDRDSIASRRLSASSDNDLLRLLNFGIWDLDASLLAGPPCLQAESYLPASLVCAKRWDP
jgi:hypothetical protein